MSARAAATLDGLDRRRLVQAIQRCEKGHLAGDDVLRLDCRGDSGGGIHRPGELYRHALAAEEFAVILPNTGERLNATSAM